jgi:CRISPR/Cas system CSM-associated protein Csm3 (group 7 of RAMP superfamily)
MTNLVLTITLGSALHHGSGFGLSGLVDRTVLRDASGSPYLAASAIKGKLRHATLRVLLAEGQPACHTGDVERWCVTQSSCALCRLFGSPRSEGALFFTDAYPPGDTRKLIEELAQLRLPGGLSRDSTTRSQTSIDRKFGTARPHLLFSTEVLPSFLTFESMIHGGSSDHFELLRRACRVITHFGADGARGLGECTLAIREEAAK